MSDERASGSGVEWDDPAEGTLSTLVQMIPANLRPLAEGAARAEAEVVAAERGATSVGAEDVVRGWIRTTPPEQRDSLVEVIDDLGFDPELFAEELQSEEGWGEEQGSQE